MRMLQVALLITPILFLSIFSAVDAHEVRGPDCREDLPNYPACTTAHSHGGLQYSLESPLSRDIITIEGLLTTILNVLLVLAVPIIVFFLIFAGFTYVTAQGNPEKIKTATRSLTYAIIGGVLILGGVAISEIIASVVQSFRT